MSIKDIQNAMSESLPSLKDLMGILYNEENEQIIVELAGFKYDETLTLLTKITVDDENIHVTVVHESGQHITDYFKVEDLMKIVV
jgi:hypothetical protein